MCMIWPGPQEIIQNSSNLLVKDTSHAEVGLLTKSRGVCKQLFSPQLSESQGEWQMQCDEISGIHEEIPAPCPIRKENAQFLNVFDGYFLHSAIGWLGVHSSWAVQVDLTK